VAICAALGIYILIRLVTGNDREAAAGALIVLCCGSLRFAPFVMRFDTGSVPVGYLVLSSDTKTITEIQDQALNKVRPMFASLPGVSAPPPFGGSQRTVVIRLNAHDDNYPSDPTYALFDDVAITGSAPPPPNPVTNGGFETGSFTGWSTSGNCSSRPSSWEAATRPSPTMSV